MIQDITTFASRFNVAAADAYVLPALFERAAYHAKMPVRSLVTEATFNNAALGEYLAAAARKVAADDRKSTFN